MPKLMMINEYQISIWSNENGEPIHVYISKRKPSQNSTKLCLLSNGTFVMADPNDKRIKQNDLKSIINKLNLNAIFIRDSWIAYHGYEKYYR